ncbi:TetR/AcrR family transcriptional regulator [Brevibacillus panacihumi]|uniref:TetR/AcrR family transcriptional regulator n=1 Tax=Brevibacillus panacihumi TaxID=497735 RepID=A0A3M8C113_9BACL|nr:TetR/AcrR family transcriptional regulator [Brevibacillus panacihumi]RNB69067.1 TetR/AcrR family transcriptional regulator [Brevibacillus panacihumi]
MRRNKEETAITIQTLIEVARTHFTERGYADAALEEIVQEAGLTRGALYHHFGNKKGLFQAVLDTVQKEVAERVETQAATSADVWEQLILGCRAFITAAVEPRNKRIMLLDGPAVLGWEEWRRMDEQNSMRLLRAQIQFMQQQGELRQVAVDALTHMLSGAMNEAALWIAQAAEDEQAYEESMIVISLLLEGLRRPDRTE